MLKKKIYALCSAAGIIIGSLGIVPIGAAEESNGIGAAVQENITDINTDAEKNSSNRFSDVYDTDWYYSYVEYLAKNNIVKGVTSTEFSPSGTFTVAESAAIITRYLGLEQAAADRQSAMEMLNIKGSDKWYAGYIQLMHEAGIIDVSEYGCTVYDRHIAIDTPEQLESPVKRYEFVSFIIRSFELDGTEIKTDVETKINASDYILGGAYDESLLEKYIPHIKDYSSIPAEYNYYVLKAYYNGIINGDSNGNFNPLNNLSRAEMAKVAAVIIDASQRVRIDVSAPVREKYELNQASYITKKDEKFIKTSVTDAILLNEAGSVNLIYENNQPLIVYSGVKDAPAGYSLDLYHYTKDKSGFDIDIKTTGNSDEEYLYKNSYSVGDRLVIAISDSKTGETFDAYEFTLLQDGLVREDWCAYLP